MKRKRREKENNSMEHPILPAVRDAFIKIEKKKVHLQKSRTTESRFRVDSSKPNIFNVEYKFI